MRTLPLILSLSACATEVVLDPGEGPEIGMSPGLLRLDPSGEDCFDARVVLWGTFEVWELVYLPVTGAPDAVSFLDVSGTMVDGELEVGLRVCPGDEPVSGELRLVPVDGDEVGTWLVSE